MGGELSLSQKYAWAHSGRLAFFVVIPLVFEEGRHVVV